MPIIKQKNWTYEEYYILEDGKRYEIIEGELTEMSPAPRYQHQFILSNLFNTLFNFIKKTKSGQVLCAPLDIILDNHTTLQPDIIYISNENKGIIQERGVFGSPDCVVEILSPSTKSKDKGKKFKLYEQFAVKEYWMVDPEAKSIEVYSIDHHKYKLLCSAKVKEELQSTLFKSLEIDINELFSNND